MKCMWRIVCAVWVAAVAAAVLGVAAVGCVADEPEWALQQGDALPRFCVTTLDGDVVSSEDSRGRELVIVFFATWCPDCRRELPLIQEEYEANMRLPAAEQAQYVCISREEGPEVVEKYWNEAGLTMPVSAQTDRAVYSLFASAGIPRVFTALNGVITSARE